MITIYNTFWYQHLNYQCPLVDHHQAVSLLTDTLLSSPWWGSPPPPWTLPAGRCQASWQQWGSCSYSWLMCTTELLGRKLSYIIVALQPWHTYNNMQHIHNIRQYMHTLAKLCTTSDNIHTPWPTYTQHQTIYAHPGQHIHNIRQYMHTLANICTTSANIIIYNISQ